MKVVINRCYGGIGFSKAVFDELGIKYVGYGFLGNEELGLGGYGDEWRVCPPLIAAIEKIGLEKSSGEFASLEIVDIPDGVNWEIDDYDGIETIHEVHRSWS